MRYGPRLGITSGGTRGASFNPLSLMPSVALHADRSTISVRTRDGQLTQRTDFNGGDWVVYAGTASGGADDPDGGTDAFLFDATGVYQVRNADAQEDGGWQTYSVYAKASGDNSVFAIGDGSVIRIAADAQTHTITGGTHLFSRVTPAADDWYLYEVTFVEDQPGAVFQLSCPSGHTVLVYNPGINVANAVTQWGDLSGNGNSPVQATTTRQGSLVLADPAFGLKKSLAFFDPVAVQALAKASVTEIPQPYTILTGMVFGDSADYALGCDGSTEDFSRRAIIGKNNSDNVPYLYAGASQVMNAVGPVATDPQVYLAEFNGASSKLFVSSLTETATGDAGDHPFSGFTLGGGEHPGGGLSMRGRIRIYYVFPGLLGASRDPAIQWAAKQCGIVL